MVIALFSAGCVNTPALSEPFATSRPLSDRSIKDLLQPGMPRAEVTAELGQPLFELEGGRVLGYVWEKNFIASEKASTGYTLNQEVSRKSWGLWIEVDEKGGVVRHYYGRFDAARSAREQALEWFQKGTTVTRKAPSP